MAEPARKQDSGIEPDIAPDLRAIQGGGESTSDRGNLRAVNDQELNPEALNKDGSVADKESTPSNVIQGPWANNVSKNNTPGGIKFDKLKFIKKRGPLAGIILTLVGGAIGMGGLLAPGLGIVHLKEIFTNALNDSEPALSQRTLKMLAMKADGVKNSFAESKDGKCNVKCKFGTMNDAMKRNLEAKGFEVKSDSSRFPGRHVVTEITFPDKKTVTKNGADFKEALKNPARASEFNKVFNSKTAYFLNSKFGSMLKSKLGLNKIAELAGNTKEKVVESMRKAMGLEGASAAVDPALKLSAEERARTGKFKAAFSVTDTLQSKALGKGANVVGAACVLYGGARDISIAVKMAKMAQFAALAMIVLKLADQIKSGDSPDPAVVEQVGNQLTQTDINKTITGSGGKASPNAFFGKSAFDSVGYKSAAFGDNPGTLSAQDQTYSTAPVGALAAALGTLTALLVKGGEPAIAVAHGLCKTAGNTVLAVFMTCGTEIVAALATAVETAGVGAFVSLAWCGAKLAFITAGIAIAISQGIGAVKDAILGSELPNIDENTIGAAAGDAIYTGSAGILGGASATYAMKAGTSADIKQYALDTAAIKEQNDAIARYDAQKTPLNVYDKYSFLGSIVDNLNIVSLANSSVASNFGSILSLIPHAFASLVPTSRATETTTEAQKKAGLYGGVCPDQGLSSVNVDADSFCNPSYVMSSTEMNADSNTVIDYMVKNNDIDLDTGSPVAGSEYEKFITNCADRIEPLGETAAPIESDDYIWSVGLKCTSNSEQLSNFRSYHMDVAISDTMDGDPTPTTPAPASGSTAVGNTKIDYTDAGADIVCANEKPGTTPVFQDGYYENSNGTINLMYGGSPYKVSKVKIRICQIGNGIDKPVNSQISASATQMLKDNSKLRVVSGFRDMALQTSLWLGHPDRAWVARPGTSNHQMGIAMDLGCGGYQTITSGDSCFNWLKANASKYGFTNYAPEPWHWSVGGN